MKLRDVNEIVEALLDAYPGSIMHTLERYVQVLWNPNDKSRHFRISFEKEKSGGYSADVFYKTCLGNVHTRINKRSQLEACMSIEKGGTNMKVKVNDAVNTPRGEGVVVFIMTVVNKRRILVKIPGFNGYQGSSATTRGWINKDGKADKWFFFEESLTLVKRKEARPNKIITNDPFTIILWENGDKTSVKCEQGDEYNALFGIALATLKYQFGNNKEASLKAYNLLKEHTSSSKGDLFTPEVLERFKNRKLNILVSSQEDYDELMKYLQKKGFSWISGDAPTKLNFFEKSSTLVIKHFERDRISYAQYIDSETVGFNFLKGFK